MNMMNYIDLMDSYIESIKYEGRPFDGEDILFLNNVINLAASDRNIAEKELECIEETLHIWHREYKKGNK